MVIPYNFYWLPDQVVNGISPIGAIKVKQFKNFVGGRVEGENCTCTVTASGAGHAIKFAIACKQHTASRLAPGTAVKINQVHPGICGRIK